MFNFKICFIFAFCLTSFGSYAQTSTPFNKTCGGENELSFFNNAHSYTGAKTACKTYGGSLVKIRSAEIQRAIEKVVPIQPFFIDGFDEDKDNVFYWDDKSRVPLRGESGYQNWQWNQPNSDAEQCMLIGEHGKMKWFDTQCNVQRRYICQRGSRYVMTMTSTTTTATCQSSATSVRWERNSAVVQPTDTYLVHQTVNSDGSVATLNFANSNILETGTYSCVATSPHCSVQRIFTVTADGTPTISSIANNKCNSSLLVTWIPSKAAVGFPHRFVATNSTRVTVYETPGSNEHHTTEISGLQESAQYTVEVSACLTMQSCDARYKAQMNSETNGVTGLITASRLATAENGNCVVSWDKPDKASSFTVEIQCVLYPIRSGTMASTTNKTIATNSLIFQPLPSRKCEVFIQVKECEQTSKRVKADGVCLTSAKEPEYVQPPALFTNQNGNSYVIEIQRPRENNGLISCVILIVCHGKCSNNQFTFEKLKRANKTDVANPDDKEYFIAAAFPILSFTSKQYLHNLLNGNTTFCDVYNKGLPNTSASSTATFRGQNIVAKNSLEISMFVVATTPSDSIVLLKSSAVVNFKSETKHANTVTELYSESDGNTVGEQPKSDAAGNSGWTAELAIGLTAGIVTGVIGTVATVFIMRRRQSDVNSEPARETTNDGQTDKASTTAILQQQDSSAGKYENEPSASTYEEIKENKGARVQNQDPSPYGYENEPPAGAYEEMKSPGGNQDSGGYETFIA